jgi:hypothetical protein
MQGAKWNAYGILARIIDNFENPDLGKRIILQG